MSATPIVLPARALPAELHAGDALAFAIATGLAPGSVVFLILEGVIANTATRQRIPTGQPGTGVAVDASGTASFNVPSTVTATWAAGRYDWAAFAIDTSGARSELGAGTVRILPDFDGAVPVDPRTENEQLLGQVKALLKGKALDDVFMYKINNRELTRMNLRELLEWEATLTNRVRRERIARGERVPSRTTGIVFGGG